MAGAVELAQAPKAGRERNLGDRKVGVVKKAPREMCTRRAGQPIGRHTQMRDEEATQMPCGHAKPGAKLGFARTVERAVENQLYRSTNELGAVPRDLLRRSVRPAAQAGTVAGSLGRGSARIAPDVLGTRLRATPRQAIDAGGDDRADRFHATTLFGRRKPNRPNSDSRPGLVRKRRAFAAFA